MASTMKTSIHLMLPFILSAREQLLSLLEMHRQQTENQTERFRQLVSDRCYIMQFFTCVSIYLKQLSVFNDLKLTESSIMRFQNINVAMHMKLIHNFSETSLVHFQCLAPQAIDMAPMTLYQCGRQWNSLLLISQR
jgi:hypothetical protein